MNPKEKFLDRMEQTFMILINQKELLIWSAVIYGGIYIITMILWKILMGILIFDALFFIHSINYVILIMGCVVWLSSVIIYIGIFLGFIKYLSDINKWLSVKLKISIICGMKKIPSSCYTYYYIFLYVYLIPALFFIGWLVFILSDLMNGKIGLERWVYNSQYANIWFILIGISFFLSVYFVIYRWIRSSFALYNAVDKDDFSKTSFRYSLHLTENQWMRIFWNLIWMGFIIWLATSIFSGLLSTGGSSIDTDSFMAIKEGNLINIKHILNGVFSIGIGNILSSILSGIVWLFSLTFTYIFFKRLELESWAQKIVELPIKMKLNIVDL